MPPLPVLSGEERVRNFEHFGWQAAWQRGSHIVMTKAGETAQGLRLPSVVRLYKGAC